MGRRAGRDDLGATIFFQLVSARYERGSIILTSKKKLEARPLVQRRSSGGTKLPSRSNTGVSKTRVSGTGPLVGVPKTLVFDPIGVSKTKVPAGITSRSNANTGSSTFASTGAPRRLGIFRVR